MRRAILVAVVLSGVGFPLRAQVVDDFTVGGDRPVAVHVPASYEPGVAAPLVLGLHGYGGNGDGIDNYWRFGLVAESRGLLYAHPDGTQETDGTRFWNSTPACCNFFGSTVDDSGFLKSVIEEIQTIVDVDPDRIFIFGHSNGGFMCHRMACDHAGTVAAIVSLAGAAFLDPADCAPEAPVHVLQIHGTADATIRYPGGTIGEFFVPQNLGWPAYPGALATLEQWATHNGCDLVAEHCQRVDLDAGLPGSETTITRYASGCQVGGSSELWTIEGGAHGPNFNADYAELVADWLLKHPKGVATRACFTVTPGTGTGPLEVTFDASVATSAAGSTIGGYDWDFGDGTTANGMIVNHTFTEAGRRFVTLSLSNDAGLVDNVSKPVSILCPSGDVSPWSAADIGEPAYRGTVRQDAGEGGTLRICAGGQMISGREDGGLLVHQELTGDIRITAKISEITSDQAGASAGLMFRESLDADARFAAVCLDTSSTEDRVGILRFRYRTQAGDAMRSRSSEPVSALPLWVRIDRSVDTLIGWSSLDGETWTLIHETDIPDLPATLLGGVGAAGRDINPEKSDYDPLQVAVSQLDTMPLIRFVRGDCDGDGVVGGSVTDAVLYLHWAFLGGATPKCLAACDVDGDGEVGGSVNDAVHYLYWAFLGGAPPPPPLERCGAGTDRDQELGCETPSRYCAD